MRTGRLLAIGFFFGALFMLFMNDINDGKKEQRRQLETLIYVQLVQTHTPENAAKLSVAYADTLIKTRRK